MRSDALVFSMAMMSSDTTTMPSLRSSTIVVPYTFTSLRVQKNSLPW